MIYSLIYLDVLHSCKRASKFCSFFNIVAILRERKREREKVCVCISFAQYPANLRATVNLLYITYTYIYIHMYMYVYVYTHIHRRMHTCKCRKNTCFSLEKKQIDRLQIVPLYVYFINSRHVENANNNR